MLLTAAATFCYSKNFHLLVTPLLWPPNNIVFLTSISNTRTSILHKMRPQIFSRHLLDIYMFIWKLLNYTIIDPNSQMKSCVEVVHKLAHQNKGNASSRQKQAYSTRCQRELLVLGIFVWLYNPWRKKGHCPKGILTLGSIVLYCSQE